ncbi:MAG: hypothetical protein ACRYFX_03965 [Janthinobacterium lividum]
MSDSPSTNLGGLLAGLFGSRTASTDDTARTGGLTGTHKVVGGALLAAGAAYLYKRYQNKQNGVTSNS